MGQTLTEKIIANNARKVKVIPGEIVTVAVDRVFAHDIFATTVITEFEKLGKPLWRPDGVVLIIDHDVPSTSSNSGNIYQRMAEFSRSWGIDKFHYGEGICHQLMPEKGYVIPGSIVIGTDSHTVTYGALGALATGMGSTEMAGIWSRGSVWLKVPHSIQIRLEGSLGTGVTAKDVILHLIGRFGADGCTYKAIEFTGEGVAALSMEQRLTISNMVVEMGAKNGIFPVDEITESYLSDRGITDYQRFASDHDAHYQDSITVDLATLVPQLAGPGKVDSIHPVDELAGKIIHQGFIGSCTNGRLSDLREAATYLQGRQVAPFVKLIITPASRTIYQQAMEEGLITIFLEAGGVVTNPGCGLCFGKLGGVIGPTEVAVCSNNRNFPGRLGHPSAEIYLASPATVAASVVAGCLTNPQSRH
ncbi:MAG: 3-isopropylmalate dehydratase large subunit [Magnetococcales bacterium]|nr:3-isopropylmalate dehydratase large subunit [Magnetococcales bacterium]